MLLLSSFNHGLLINQPHHIHALVLIGSGPLTYEEAKIHCVLNTHSLLPTWPLLPFILVFSFGQFLGLIDMPFFPTQNK